MLDFLFQQLSTVQDNLMPTPPTLASSTTIAPTTFLTYISGTAQVATVTPPINGVHMLVLVFTDSPGTFLTSGNVSQAIVPTQNLPTFLFYNPITATYTGCATNLT